MTILTHASQAAWTDAPWRNCKSIRPNDNCIDYKLAEECTWTKPGMSENCDRYQQILINTRGFQQRKSPFMSFVHGLMFKRSITVNDWEPPSFVSIACALFLWIIVGIISIGGSKVLGRTGIVSLVLLLFGSMLLLSLGISFGEWKDIVSAFFYEIESYEDRWTWIWSWADAAAHSLRALKYVGCGGIQKFASLNNFHNKIHKDVLILSFIAYLFYITTGLLSFMFMAAMGQFYYPDLVAIDRVNLYATPVMIESVISEVLK
ncbi:unnamed protein product [Caenorhabditis brenneri]